MTGDEPTAETDESTVELDETNAEGTASSETDATADGETSLRTEAMERAAGDEFAHVPGDTALLLDAMLGKLSTYLRMCGYDATYSGGRGVEADDRVLALAHTEGRVLVTRDRELARRADRSVLLSSRDVADQLRELHEAGFALGLADEPVRCSACNGLLESVDWMEPTPEYAPETHEQPVWRCRDCGQHFWKGSHWDDVAATIAEL